MDFAFMGGSMGSAVGEKFARACDRRVASECPLLLVSSSGGARMQEGILSLMQLPEDRRRARRAPRGRPADVQRADRPDDRRRDGELRVVRRRDDRRARGAPRVHRPAGRPGDRQGEALATTSAGPNSISATARSTPSSPDPSSARIWRGSSGSLAGEAERRLRERLGRLKSLPLLHRTGVSGEERRLREQLDSIAHVDASEDEIWAFVERARHPDRPYTLDYVERILDDWVELHGDRGRADDGAIVTGLGRLEGRTVALIGHQKGRDLKERLAPPVRHAAPGGVRQGCAGDGDRRPLPLPRRLAHRHARRVPGRGRRAARAGRGDRPFPGRDARARGAHRRLRDRRRSARAARSRSPSPTVS